MAGKTKLTETTRMPIPDTALARERNIPPYAEPPGTYSFDPATFGRRTEEPPASLQMDRIRLTHASHIGPNHAGKRVNQDATFALRTKSGCVFALADGVDTSMGAGIAAAAAVREFCRFIEANTDTGSPGHHLPISAARHVYLQLNAFLDYFMEKSNEPDAANDPQLKLIRGVLQPETAIRLCRNTLKPSRRHWAPVLSTTLLGGIAEIIPGKIDTLKVSMLCIGDGIVEHFRINQHTITPRLDIDRNNLTITTSMCPGPGGSSALRIAKIMKPIEMKPGDTLLLSSDGLARGHNDSIWEKINSFCTNHILRYSANEILRNAAAYADDRQNLNTVDRDPLFGDNLSLLLFTLE